jgi:electron transport complex protein RnfD
MMPIVISSPHAHDNSSVNRVMLHVCFALTPCTIYGIYLFGFPALNLFLITCISAILWESMCFKLLGTPQTRLGDGSALLTGWLLALTLPPWAPWWIGVGGSFIAIVIGKQLYGGLGQNVFNPAMLARVALLISFPVQMTTWPDSSAGFSSMSFAQGLSVTLEQETIPDGFTGATALGLLKTELIAGTSAEQIIDNNFSLQQSFFGNTSGSLGETSSLLILAGGLWLLLMRIITWHIPLALLGVTALLSGFFHWFDPSRYADTSFHLTSGGMMLGAFFIATDMVTSPSSKTGQLLFGAGCGAVDFSIRVWGGFPEGMGFAVLFMNALTPLIDIYLRPRVYGRNFRGQSLKAAASKDAERNKP